MKKSLMILSLLFVFCLVLTGCGKKEDNKENDNTKVQSGAWETVMPTRKYEYGGKELDAFKAANKNYKDMVLEPIAYLGSQVVSGTNYMFLAKGYTSGNEKNATYKIVIVYTDLQKNSSITSVKDFDYSKYVSKAIDYKDEEIVGGWEVYSPSRPEQLDSSEDHEVFTKAVEGLTGVYYAPSVVVAKQVVAGTNYAILCYGKTSTQTPKNYLFLLTIYKDLEGKVTLSSIANIDLADLN